MPEQSARSINRFNTMKTLILDNYDSFTYNLFQCCAELGGNPEVFRNDKISLGKIAKNGYTHIIISPGPGSPENKKDFGICGEVIEKFKGSLPILGVCLGHQGIIGKFGGRVIKAPVPVHGKRSLVRIDTGSLLFKGLPESIDVMRYHSLIGDMNEISNSELKIIAKTAEDNLIMGISHKKYPLFGVQFHPESVGTKYGEQILENFLAIKPAHDLSLSEAKKTLKNMAAGEISDEKMAEILIGLAQKGECISEIVGMAQGMREMAIKLPLGKEILMDTCGTGGSGLKRMNISTASAFVLAACGVKIAKHGNKAASGRCGSFDLLEKLGVNINLNAAQTAGCIKKLGIGFIFAPLFHPAMKRIAPVRKELGIRTIFNLLGPLTNPARPKFHLLGTTSVETAEKMAEAAKRLGYVRALVVVGENGLDDVTLAGKTHIFDLNRGKITKYDFSPEDAGLAREKNFEAISGGGVEQNAETFLLLLQNKGPRPLQNLLALNAGFGLAVRGKAKNVREGVAMAQKAIESCAAHEKFLAYKKLSNSFSFRRAICGKDKISIIAEIKRRSPSHGNFRINSIKNLIKDYEKGGAGAISIVTEPRLFGGSLNLLKQVKKLTNLPILRKDFITTERQIDETAKVGANAVLLIAKNLKKEDLAHLAAYAQTKNLDPLVEIYDAADLEKISGLKNILIGINNRNLKTFETEVGHAKTLLSKIDPANVIVAESAFNLPKDLDLYKGKIDAALIGTAFLAAKNPLQTLTNFIC